MQRTVLNRERKILQYCFPLHKFINPATQGTAQALLSLAPLARSSPGLTDFVFLFRHHVYIRLPASRGFGDQHWLQVHGATNGIALA